MSGHALAKVTVNRAHSALDSIDQDWRFAELTAQCCLDPALAVRYAVEPRSVLAEFGIPTDERTHIPALPTGLGCEVTITSLNPRDTVGHSALCDSWTYAAPAEQRIPTVPISPIEPGC
ncbi:hypothetical protein ACQEU8_26695 [Streptomyces sp. CA-250714]|uniref:hypothetical protein n=1 Tax=Streptomyces sp. CA-250714 TaxID=3240060 RepID=UPI003D8E0775